MNNDIALKIILEEIMQKFTEDLKPLSSMLNDNEAYKVLSNVSTNFAPTLLVEIPARLWAFVPKRYSGIDVVTIEPGSFEILKLSTIMSVDLPLTIQGTP